MVADHSAENRTGSHVANGSTSRGRSLGGRWNCLRSVEFQRKPTEDRQGTAL
jgi:hypothetical protein